MKNKSFYDSKKVVDIYSDIENQLLDSEREFILKYDLWLKNKTMLDLGVGGGRTIPFFAELVKEYVGIDLSKNMVRRCRERFPNKKFIWENAVTLNSFKSSSFDFILFSYNGIDDLPFKLRIKSMKRIKELLKEGGLFLFSSHNLNYIHYNFNLPNNSLKNLLKKGYLFFKNPFFQKIKRRGFGELYLIYLRKKFFAFHISPEKQIEQLHKIGFGKVEIIGSIEGPSIHYLCKK